MRCQSPQAHAQGTPIATTTQPSNAGAPIGPTMADHLTPGSDDTTGSRISPPTRRHARWAITIGLACALGVAGLMVGLLIVHGRGQHAVDRVVARACQLPTDAAGRRYIQLNAPGDGASYIDSLRAMYRRCPRSPGGPKLTSTSVSSSTQPASAGTQHWPIPPSGHRESEHSNGEPGD